ncbi:MAG: protein-disulfide reductase DsbD domain-containing protein [Candidatus Acidiferrales bacterium]
MSAIAGASSVVRTRTFVSLEPIPAGKEFQVAVVVDIAPGYHVNSNKPSDPYLIPTTITPRIPSGFKLLGTIYPQGRDRKFAFSPDKPLNVYTGSVTIRLRIAARSDVQPGIARIPMILRYQACNDTTCLPPVKLPVSVQLKVAAAGTKTRPDHPEIFPATSLNN